KGSQEYAEKVIEEAYNDANWDPSVKAEEGLNPHNVDKLKEIDNNMKITSEEDMAKIITGVKVTYQGMPDKDYVFDGGTYTFTPLSDFTMDFLKQNIYDSILSMLFDDSNEMYGHSESLSGYEA